MIVIFSFFAYSLYAVSCKPSFLATKLYECNIYYQINEEELTQELLTLPDIKKHVCVVFDYSPNPAATLYNQHRMANWAELFHAINRYDLFSMYKFSSLG